MIAHLHRMADLFLLLSLAFTPIGAPWLRTPHLPLCFSEQFSWDQRLPLCPQCPLQSQSVVKCAYWTGSQDQAVPAVARLGLKVVEERSSRLQNVLLGPSPAEMGQVSVSPGEQPGDSGGPLTMLSVVTSEQCELLS